MSHPAKPRRLATCLVATALAVASPSLASAQEPEPAPPVAADAPPPPVAADTPPPPAPPEARAAVRSDDVRYTDAHADRVVLGSTAETHPQGTFFISDYEIALVQIGYAVTDDLQLSLAGVPPIAKDQPYFFDFGLKLNVVRNETFRAALTGALDVITSGGSDQTAYWGGRLGGIGQFCFEGTCRSSLSLNAGTFLSSGSKDVLPVYGSAGLIAKISPRVSLLAEPSVLGVMGTGDVHVNGGALFAFDYGVRIAGKNFGVDLTFLEPLATTSGSFDNPFVLGYPFVAFTYRSDGDAPATAQSAIAARPSAL